MEKDQKIFRTPLFVVLLFSSLILLLLLGAHFYFQRERREIKDDQHRFLAVISSFKVNEISAWMNERKVEGRFVASNRDFLTLVKKLNTTPDDKTLRDQVESWLIPVKKSFNYSAIVVFSPRGELLASAFDSAFEFEMPDSSALRMHAVDYLANTDIHRNSRTGSKSITSAYPLWHERVLIGFVLFGTDPAKMLFPMITNWPIKMATGENLLIEVNGDTLTYLVDRPQYSRAPSFLRSQTGDSLAKALPAGGTLAMVEANDYRGTPVLADIMRIPGTRWSLITKIDQKEVYAPLRSRAFSIFLYLLAFFAISVVSVLLMWKNQQLQFYRNQYTMQQASVKAEGRIKFMSALLEEVNDAIITFDKDLMIQSWNKGAEKIYGWTAEDVVGKYSGGSLRIDFSKASREAVFKELEQSGSWKGEVVHKRKDGTTVYLLTSTSQLLDEQGNILGIMTISKDISEVINSEKSRNAVYRISELAHSISDTNELYTSIHIVIGELMDARNLYIALLEPDRKTLSFPYFVDEKESPPTPSQLGNGLTEFVLRSGKPLLARPEDSQYMMDRGMIELVGEPSLDWLGVPLKIDHETIGVLVVQSYSPKIRYGEKEKDILIYVSEQIALTIHRRKIQQELVIAKQNADVSSKLTSALLANMNHELRTPMNGILGFAEILMNELNDDDARGKAANILISGRRLMDTLDAIMDLSYLESDKVTRKFKPVKIEKIVKNVLASYDSVRRQKNLEFYHNVPPSLQVIGDEHLVLHLLKNLVDNAVKFTEQGSVSILVNNGQKGGAPMVSVTVKDTGIGISPENHRLIFEAFRQVSEGYGRQFEGSGLGLSISKKIVSLMGGEISLASVFGQGSEFTFKLPAVE